MAHAWMNVVYLNDDDTRRWCERKQDGESDGRSSVKRFAMIPGARRESGGISLSGQQIPEPCKQFGAGAGSLRRLALQPDGSRAFLVGYFNRNTGQTLDVPIGPNNRIEPGGPDLGQPTHFLPGRRYGMFLVPVPKDFTPQDKYTWTIVGNGQSTSIPLRLNTDYVVNPFSEIGAGNTPPVLQFEQTGPKIQGPIALLSAAVNRTTSLPNPFPITLWASEDEKYRQHERAAANPLHRSGSCGPVSRARDGDVRQGESSGGETAGAAPVRSQRYGEFSAPGDYVLHVTANDFSGDGGGGVCCWTTAMVKVTVTPKAFYYGLGSTTTMLMVVADHPSFRY
jgi:hypothetical protein